MAGHVREADLAIDQGGCVATARPTTLSEPTYLAHEVVRAAVAAVAAALGGR